MSVAATALRTTPRPAPALLEDVAAAAMEAVSEGVVAFDDGLRIQLLSRRAMGLLGLGRNADAPETLSRLLEISPRLNQRATAALLGTCLDALTSRGEEPPLAEQALPGAPGLLFALRRTTIGTWVLRIAEAPPARLCPRLAPDALTGLASRDMFLARLAAQLDRPASRRVAGTVLVIGLEGARAVADTLGRDAADALLCAVTQRLGASLREQDLAARLADDEFGVLQGEAPDPAAAEALARRLVATLSEPYRVAGDLLGLGAHIGLAMTVTDGADAEQLVRRAALACRRARPHGQGAVRRFDPAMDAEAQSSLALEAALRRAVSDEVFCLHYQPQIALEGGRLTGFEALLRWTDPVHGSVPPAHFIPLAERLGLMTRLGGWVLMRACRDAAGWPGAPGVSVNIAPSQFEDGTLVSAVTHALEASGLPPRRLELEVTESVLLASGEGVLAQLAALRRLGIRIAMDDFGTGHSSLARLSSFPFDRLKIDRCFVSHLTEGGQAATIVRAVAELGQRLGLATTAEGVETREQLDGLRGLGCTEAQGFLIGRPMPATEVPAAIARLADGARQA